MTGSVKKLDMAVCLRLATSGPTSQLVQAVQSDDRVDFLKLAQILSNFRFSTKIADALKYVYFPGTALILSKRNTVVEAARMMLFAGGQVMIVDDNELRRHTVGKRIGAHRSQVIYTNLQQLLAAPETKNPVLEQHSYGLEAVTGSDEQSAVKVAMDIPPVW